MTDGSSCTGREGECGGGESRSSSCAVVVSPDHLLQLSEKESGFLERVAVRVAEKRKGVFFCRGEEEKAAEGCGEEEAVEGCGEKGSRRVCLVKAERRKITQMLGEGREKGKSYVSR